jgi:hypothetical protein
VLLVPAGQAVPYGQATHNSALSKLSTLDEPVTKFIDPGGHVNSCAYLLPIGDKWPYSREGYPWF